MTLKVAELESLFTADVSNFAKGAAQVETQSKALDGKRLEMSVDAETKGALSDLSRVESASRGLPDGEFEVDADTSPAEREIDGLPGKVAPKGESVGGAFMGGFLGGLASVPIAGAVVGLAASIGELFTSGFQNEVRVDRLMATTGMDAMSAGTIGRGAGEAYANNWGEGIAANMETARLAIQAGLLDPKATKRDSENIIASLSGVADVIGEDIARVTRTTTTLLRTGLAATADDAFDIIIKGQQEGLNVSEDWLDTLNEYSTKFRDLGITAPMALGLMGQAVQAGARDTDKAADALKEFSIRAQDGSDATVEAFQWIGLNADDMRERISAGGPAAQEALGMTLDALRAIEDPALRNAAAVGLFGTQAEDLGEALYAMDVKTATKDLSDLAGTAKTALSTLTDNAANDVATAQRNIELATDGIKGALAAAFSPQIEEWAASVTENRAGIMEFLLGIANGGLDMARTFVEFTAGSTENIGAFISGPMADLAENIAGILDGLSWAGMGLPGAQDAANDMRGFADSMREVDDTTQAAADTMRTQLIANGLDPLQERLNVAAEQLVWDAKVHDSQVRLANNIDDLGYKADGTKESIELLRTSTGDLYTSSELVDGQIQSVVESMKQQAETSIIAGENQDDLTTSLNESRDALINQLEQLGLTEEQAKTLADAMGAIPEDIVTTVTMNTAVAQARLEAFINANQGRSIGFNVNGVRANALGGIVQPMAEGGFSGDQLGGVAQMVPPGTLRVVGDRLDVDEAFIPLDGSPRSLAILAETVRRMPGVQGMADGGISSGSASSGDTYVIGDIVMREDEITAEVVAFFQTIKRRARQAQGGRR